MNGRKAAGWLLWGALLLVVLAQTQAALAKDLKDGPFVSGADLFAALLFGVWALWALATGEWRRIRIPPLAAWVLVAVAIVSLGRADSPEALKSGIVDVAQYVLYFLCVYALFLNAITDEASVRRVVGLLCVLTAIMVVVGLLQSLSWADPNQPSETFRKVSSTFGIGEIIAETPIGQKLHLAGRSSRSIYCSYLLMALPVVFALGLRRGLATWEQAILIPTVGIGAVTMLSGWHFWALVAVILALSLRHRLKTALIVAAIVAVFMLVSPRLCPRNYQANVVELMDFYETGVIDESAVVSEEFEGGELPTTTEVKKRWIEWQPALNLLRDSPVFGVGTGGYQLHIGQHYGWLPNFKKIEPDTNCGWLVIAGSMGICGLIALVALFYSQYRAAASCGEKAPTEYLQALSAGLAGGILGLFLAMVFSSVLVRGLSITMILLLALVSVVERLSEPAAAGGDEARQTDEETTEAHATPNGGQPG